MIRSVVRGVGAYLPERILTNEEMSTIVDTTDDWIRERTGIRARHIAADGEFTSDLGIRAAKSALIRAGIDPVDIDLLICATATPDRTFPSTAVRIQHGIGMTKGAAFDVQAVCSGFVYAMVTADMFIRNGQSKRALVVGAETFSRILDWTDRGTCVLFGDGAGAIVLEAHNQPGTNDDRGDGKTLDYRWPQGQECVFALRVEVDFTQPESGARVWINEQIDRQALAVTPKRFRYYGAPGSTLRLDRWGFMGPANYNKPEQGGHPDLMYQPRYVDIDDLEIGTWSPRDAEVGPEP